MNRIDLKSKELKKRKKKAFIAFITAGDPDLRTTEQLVVAFEGAGVDIVELGVPFSDPLADGPTIQAASQRALKKHVNLENILAAVKRIHRIRRDACRARAARYFSREAMTDGYEKIYARVLRREKSR